MQSRFSTSEVLAIKNRGLVSNGQEVRTTCPYCSVNRKHSAHIRCLSIRNKGDVILYHCWHCDSKGAIPVFEKEHRPTYIPPAIKSPSRAVKTISGLSADGLAYLERRGISRETAELYQIGSGKAFFPDLREETNAIAFPYVVEGKTVGHKLRSIADKAHVCDFALKSLFGAQLVDINDSGTMSITEGEIDCVSLYEAGISNATSIPNGAQSFGTGETNDPVSLYGFLYPHKSDLDKAKKIVIATDMDEPGNRIAEELARRIGRHKCYRAKFPEKDANDTLLKHGKDVLKKCIDDAEVWPVAGLFEASHFFEKVDHLFEFGFSERIYTGIAEIDPFYSVAPGLLTIVTGNPGSGKSQTIDQLMVNLAINYGVVSAICSFENPPDVHIGKLCQIVTQKHFFRTDIPGPMLNKKELNIAKLFVNRHMKFLFQEDGAKSDLDSIIERIKTAVMRWGVRAAIIDPYNYVQRPKDMDSETQWIDEMLTKLRLFAQAYGLHIWFVAHPKKMNMASDGDYLPPRGYDISGSAAWFAKADFGITVHRPLNSPGEVHFINWKTRYDWLGKVGETTMIYDTSRHTYLSADNADVDIWRKAYEQTTNSHFPDIGHGDAGIVEEAESGAASDEGL